MPEPKNWKQVPTYQKIKYGAELIAIMGGLLLLVFNAYQLNLLKKQNEIAFQALNASNPLDVSVSLMDYKDENPLVMRFNLRNLGKDPIKVIKPILPKVVKKDSVTDASERLSALIYMHNKPSSIEIDHDTELLLMSNESCIFEVSAGMKSDDFTEEKSKVRFDKSSFIALSFNIKRIGEDSGRISQRVMLIKLFRRIDKSLFVVAEILPNVDDKSLMEIAYLERLKLSTPTSKEIIEFVDKTNPAPPKE